MDNRETEEALSSFRAAERTHSVLVGEHLLTIELRSRIVETEARIGDTAGAY